MPIPKSRCLIVVPLLALVTFVLSFAPGVASAAVQFPKLGEITGPGPGETFGSLLRESVAVDDANGHVLVADSSTHVVYDFVSASATKAVVWSGSVVPAGSVGAGSFGAGFVSVAVDSESGDVYVANTASLVVDKLDREGKYLCQITGLGKASGSPTECNKSALGPPTGALSHPDTQGPLGIAVDQATHDLYVIDSGHKAVDVFSAAVGMVIG
jgi:DNA-binding beta-propeller fold protein YncE